MRRLCCFLCCICLLTLPVSAQEAGKYVALTFDDGPSGRYTSRLLDGLKERGAHATFLLCGYRIKEYPSQVQRIIDEGHEIGSHGYSAVGAVVGATYPEQGKRLRELLPHTYFLVPGYGAQGATAKDIANAFNDDGLGAIVNSSRGIMCAWKKTGKDGADFMEAARAEAIRMRDDIVSAIR